MRVAVFDTHGAVTDYVRGALLQKDQQVWQLSDCQATGATPDSGEPEVLVISMCLPEDGTYDGLRDVVARHTGVPIAVLSGCTATDVAARLLFPAASAFLRYPLSPAVLQEKLTSLARGNGAASTGAVFGIVGNSPAMAAVYKALHALTDTDATVLLEGETGTGKELLARTIHTHSRRAARPFVAINCAGLTETLLEAELFGHSRGAFTGAHQTRLGLFEAADGGTIFLDEVADAPPSVQVRLLRVLQEREVRRVGETRTRSVDVRIVAATQRSLAEEMEEGRFREDLYYRLNVYRITIPPLRQRREDIPALLEHGGRLRGDARPMSPLALSVLSAYDWPGNVRQLWAVAESAAVRAGGRVIGLEHLPEEIRERWKETALEAAEDGTTRRESLQAVLEETGGNRVRAAAILGVSRTTLWRMMKREGLS